MKTTLGWLKEHLQTDATAAAIADRLVALGLEVEGIENPGARLAPFTVARVIAAAPHPQADRLRVCQVDTGAGQVQVVCGAPNARTGLLGVLARPGTTIPGTGVALQRATIRGVESQGMLCSASELGLGDDHDGIIELEGAPALGTPVAAVLGLDDPVFDIKVTPERGDCLGVLGLARDLAAAGLGSLRARDSSAVAGTFASPIRVHLQFDDKGLDACPYFVGRAFRGLRNGPSPAWLQRRLRAIGLRPISALVDITNYLTYDVGRPLHVFDLDTLKGDLRLALGHGGKRFTALNDKEYQIDDQMTAILDDDGLLALAGVMGGASSGCTEATRTMFLEVACFDPIRTALTGRKLGIQSDARYRFERGIDPAYLVRGAEYATRLILELCGGEASELVIAGKEPEWRRQIPFRASRVQGLGGVAVAEAESVRILESLGFTVTGLGEDMLVTPPSWRRDVEGEADLVEEVIRVHGFDRIPPVSLHRTHAVAAPALSPAQRRVRFARRALAARGMVEAVTFSFLAPEQAALFGGDQPELRLANAISAELSVMRPSLLPNLLAAAGRNADRGYPDLALFEVGPQYRDDTPAGQQTVAGALRHGLAAPRHWRGGAHGADAFDAKADLLAAIEACGGPAERAQVAAEAPAWYHPGRAGTLRLGKAVLGHFGEIHPAILKAFGLPGPAAACELFLAALPELKDRQGRTRPLLYRAELQPLVRDFAFVVDQDVAAEAVVRAARGADKALIVAAGIFDLYQGPGVPEGKKSLALSLTLQPTARSLTDADLEALGAKVVAAVAAATGATLRV
ncbi:MAG: phenylalanine--tRNA ligase subunit beta [Alphaproteobacteria bacterium]|nr:phenylalanine--tRNA ligase subunit beta [Alphaproteobacteria bacterium]